MRILHVLDTPQYAGTEAHLLCLARASIRLGLQPAILCREATPLLAAANKAGLETIPFVGAGMPGMLTALTRTVLDRPPDLLHAHNGRTMLACAVLASAQMAPAVGTQHFIDPQFLTYRGFKRRVAGTMHAWVNSQLSQVIAISESVRQAMILREGIPEDRITTVKNGIGIPRLSDPARRAQIRPELGIGPDEVMILTAARLVAEKGIRQLICAARSVVTQRPDARFVVAGEGALRVELETETRRTGLGGRFIFAGFRSDVPDLISECDLFVLPSPAEPFGLVLLEAMALGKPVVANRAGGPVEIVLDGETGLLAEPGNPTALAQTIVDALSDRARMKEMGAKGKNRYASQFTDLQMATETRKVYQRALRA